MKYFAELDSSNNVIRVLLFAADADDSVVESTPHLENGTSWVETFTDGTRGTYAGVGGTYDQTNDRFIEPQPYSSWTLQDDGTWQSPIGPTPENPMVGDAPEYSQWWDDENSRFLRFKISDAKPRQNYVWVPASSTWSEIEL
jgi:hypothetical protein